MQPNTHYSMNTFLYVTFNNQKMETLNKLLTQKVTKGHVYKMANHSYILIMSYNYKIWIKSESIIPKVWKDIPIYSFSINIYIWGSMVKVIGERSFVSDYVCSQCLNRGSLWDSYSLDKQLNTLFHEYLLIYYI